MMTKGSPNNQTIASKKYQNKVGYISKSFKMYRSTADRFKEACDKAGVSQAAKITELMEQFIKEVEDGDHGVE